jgi:uncharacterized protein (DUF1778 family)
MKIKCKSKMGKIKSIIILKPKRKAPFGIRLTPNTKELLEKKAKLKGLKLHAYCKDVLTKHAERK